MFDCESPLATLSLKAEYRAPKLMIFGLFSDLTAAGSGLSGENVGSNNRNRKP